MTILITGGSSGIGRAIAMFMAQLGSDLVLVAREQDRLDTTAEEIKKLAKVDVHVITADVSDPTAVAGVRKFCVDRKCVPDVLVLNAGIWLAGAITEAKPADIERLMGVNAYQMFHFAREFTDLLINQTNPKIIIIGSTAGIEIYPRDEGSLYSVSKWTVRSIAMNLRKELMPKNIGVTHIAPGNVMTEMWGDEGQPGRMLEPLDIAKLVATTLNLSSQACVEEIVVRPMKGNI